MYDAGWEITVASLNPWEWGAWADWSFVRRTRPDMIAPPYDLVVANYYATLPIGAQIKAKKHLALIQSDEPEWHILDRHQAEAECFRTPGYQHVIIANHMRCFGEKYGMDIVGQIDNGVDALTFYPDWFLKREWPHSLMMIRKNAPVWFTGQEYAEQAVLELAKRYDDLEVVVVGQQAPRWPCKVRHVQTYDESELRRLLNNVSCFVRPSFIEGFSLTDLEAMACGTPLVVTPIGVSDVARHGEEALFAPNVPTDEFIARGRSAETRPALGQEIVAGIVAGVTRVFEEPELREKLAMGGLRLVRERTWEKQGEQWIDCVERVMAE
jgi:glycosyltransferase involved in cell wall biosynthesis